MRHKITGTCFAANERGEALVSKGKYGAAGRRAWCKAHKPKPEIHPFKERRALRGTRAPFFEHRRTMPHLFSRIERAHRVMDPLYGYSSFSEVLDAFGDTLCGMIETKENDWAFRGQKGRVTVTVITSPLSFLPTQGNRIRVDQLPVHEVYLQIGPEMLACSIDCGPVRFNQNPNEITV